MSKRLFSASRLHTQFWQLAMLGALAGVTGCAQPEDPAAHGSDEPVIAATSTRQAELLEASTAMLIVDLDPNDIGTLQVSDILASTTDADPASFALRSATTAHGAGIVLNATGDEITYTGNPLQGWDSFDYEVCDAADATHCEVARVHLVLRGGICDGLQLQENFRGAQVEGAWKLGGNGYTANLTAAGSTPIDPDGEGWLRLSPPTNKLNGYALFDDAFPGSDGVSMTFEIASWGGQLDKGGDGLLFFLVDGDQVNAANFQTGGCCGSLGYAPFQNGTTDQPGMPHAVAGIAFDEWGSHWTGTEGRTGPDVRPPDATSDNQNLPNNITVRAGAADSWKTLFVKKIAPSTLKMTCDSAGCNTRPDTLGAGRYQATITVTPKDNNSHFILDVYTKSSDSGAFVHIAHADIPQALPQRLKLGFIGASGGSLAAYHEIRDLRVTAITDAKIQVDSSIPSATPVSSGDSVTYTYTIDNSTSGPICAANMRLKLPAGFTITDQTCTTSRPNDSCADFATPGVLQDVIALDGDGKVTITITGTVAHSSNNPSADASGEVEPGGTQSDGNPSDNSGGSSHNFNEPTLRDRTVDVLAGRDESFDVHDDVIGGDNIDYDSVALNTQGLPAGVAVSYDPASGHIKVSVDRDYSGPQTIDFTYTIDNGHGTSPPATVTLRIAYALTTSVDGSGDDQVWVATGTPQVDVDFDASEPIGSVQIISGPTDSAGNPSGEASVMGDGVRLRPDAGKEDDSDEYTIEVRLCAQADPTNCEELTVTIVYNDPPSITPTTVDQAPAPRGRTTELGFDALPGTRGQIDPARTEIVGGQNSGCALNATGDGVAFTPSTSGPQTLLVTCTVQVCEARPADLCTTHDFVFTVVDAFHPVATTIPGAQGATSTVSIADLLQGAGNANAASFTLVGTPQGGTVTLNGTDVEFTADDDATNASFQYQVCANYDPTECVTVTVTVDLARKPLARAPVVWVLQSNPPATTSVPSPFGPPTDNTIVSATHGTASIGSDGAVLVTPEDGYLGTVSVQVQGCTRTSVPACSTTTVTVIVNDLPSVQDGSAIVTPGGTQSITPLADPGAVGAIDTTSLTLISSASTPNGTCSVANGKVTFQAAADATLGAQETCSVRLCELAPADACDTADFTFEVQDIFNPSDDDLTGLEGADLVIDTASDLVGNDGNIDPASFAIVGTPDANGDFETRAGGTLRPNADGDGFTYTPPTTGFTGEDSFTYEICSGLVADDCAQVTVTIWVEARTRISSPADGDTLTDPRPTISGTAEPDSRVTITIDGNEVATVIVDETGAWDWTPDTALPNGDHTIEATGDNGSSASVEVIIDAPLPEYAPVLITSPADGSHTTDPRPTISGSGEPGATIRITVDGTEVAEVVVDNDGQWNWTPDVDFEPGAHTIGAADEFGSSDSIELTIDPDGGTPDAGGPDAGQPDAGSNPDADGPDAGTGSPDADGAPDAAGPDAGADAGPGDFPQQVVTGGRFFGCASSGHTSPPLGLGLLLAFAAGTALRRRARRRN